MRKVWIVAVLIAVVLGWADTNQAQETRIAVFGLQCFVPTLPGLHTRAILIGKVILAYKTVRFVANCFDSPSESLFPEIQMSDGPVRAIDLSVVTILENGTRQVVASNRCAAHGRNGFLAFNCLASEAQGGAGEVAIFASVATLPEQRRSAGTTP